MSGTRSTVSRAALLALRGTLLAVVVAVSAAYIVAALEAPKAVATRDADDDAAKAVAKETPAKEAQAKDTGVVTLDRESQEKGGIETAMPQSTPYQDQVRAYGSVVALDKLTALYNQAIAAQAQLKVAQVKRAASEVANDRAKNLLKVFATAQAQAEAAAATFEIDQAGVASAQAQVDILRNSAVQDWGARLGAAIAGRDPLAERLVLRRSVLVQLSLQSGSFAAPPHHVTLALSGLPSVEAAFVSDATQVDPKVQSLSFWYEAPARAGLVPGMNLIAYLPRGESKPGVGIPPSAVVWQAGKAWMFVREGSDRFERHAIDEAAAPTADGGYIVPATSLPGDKTIVVAGAQTLLSEETKAQIPTDEDDN